MQRHRVRLAIPRNKESNKAGKMSGTCIGSKSNNRASNQQLKVNASGHPFNVGWLVQFWTAVSKNPHTIAIAKPNSISCGCHHSGNILLQKDEGKKLYWGVNQVNSHKGIYSAANIAPPRKKGLKPKRHNAWVRSVCVGSSIFSIVVSRVAERWWTHLRCIQYSSYIVLLWPSIQTKS